MVALTKSKGLTPREKDILICRLGMGPDGKIWTFFDLAARHGISRTRVAQLQEQAFNKLGLTHATAEKRLDSRTYITVCGQAGIGNPVIDCIMGLILGTPDVDDEDTSIQASMPEASI